VEAGETLKPWIPRLRRYARAFLNGTPGSSETADSFVHATLLRAREMRLQVSAENGLPLFGVLTQLCREGAQQKIGQKSPAQLQARPVAQPPLWGVAAPDNVHNAFGSSRSHEGFAAALNTLKSEEREALLLVVVEGFSYTEVAHILRISRTALLARLRQARATFKECGFAPAPAKPSRPSYLRIVK